MCMCAQYDPALDGITGGSYGSNASDILSIAAMLTAKMNASLGLNGSVATGESLADLVAWGKGLPKLILSAGARRWGVISGLTELCQPAPPPCVWLPPGQRDSSRTMAPS